MRNASTNRGLTVGGVAVAATVAAFAFAAPATAETHSGHGAIVPAGTAVDEPATFTSAFTANAIAGEVVDGGQEGATGQFTFRLNSDLDIICFDITLDGVEGEYESPADTATHIHEAEAGVGGPPRIAFPDPGPITDGERTSLGCLQGPFVTGLTNDDGVDQGEGFTLAQIEADPASFYADSHTVDYPGGAVRGQLTAIPWGGVETGAGGIATSNDSSTLLGVGGILAALGLGVGGVVLTRRAALRARA